MNPSPMHTPLALSLAVLAVLASARATAQVVTLDTASGQVRIAIDEAASLPPDFPADVPLPGGYALARVDRSGAGTTLTMDAPGEVGAIAAAMASGMRANGWQAAPVTAPPGGEAQAWEKDVRAVLAWFVPGEAGTRVQLELSPRR